MFKFFIESSRTYTQIVAESRTNELVEYFQLNHFIMDKADGVKMFLPPDIFFICYEIEKEIMQNINLNVWNYRCQYVFWFYNKDYF